MWCICLLSLCSGFLSSWLFVVAICLVGKSSAPPCRHRYHFPHAAYLSQLGPVSFFRVSTLVYGHIIFWAPCSFLAYFFSAAWFLCPNCPLAPAPHRIWCLLHVLLSITFTSFHCRCPSSSVRPLRGAYAYITRIGIFYFALSMVTRITRLLCLVICAMFRFVLPRIITDVRSLTNPVVSFFSAAAVIIQ